MDLRERAKTLKKNVPALLLALRKPETPLKAKMLAVITVAYALSPIDLIPDFIPVLGYLDDLILLPALVALTVRWIPPEVMANCLTESEGMWENGKPKRWIYALPILLLWLLILWLVVKAILKR